MIPSPTNHPLGRNGQSQPDRTPPSLDPASAPLDDRDTARLLIETRDVATLVTYYNSSLSRDGTWAPFFDRHAVTQIARCARETAARLLLATARPVAELASTDPAVQRAAIVSLAGHIAAEADWLATAAQAVAATGFARVLTRAIDALVRADVHAAVLSAHAFLEADGPAAVQVAADSGTAAFWGWNADALTVPSTRPAPPFSSTRGAVLAAIRQLGRVRAYLSDAAVDAFSDGSVEDGRQPPHLGLLLACLNLFAQGQHALNDIVRRHLEYYLRDVVGFSPATAVPDHAYVVCQLARGIDSLVLPAGTAVTAGRDSARQDIVFALARETVINRARVDGLRSSFRSSTAGWRQAGIANSADGLGEALPAEDLRWPPFGSAVLPAARYGWAFATPALEVAGGTKSVELQMRFAADAADTLVNRIESNAATGVLASVQRASDGAYVLPSALEVALTGAEGWHAFGPLALTYHPDTRAIVLFTGTLGPDQPIAGCDPLLHGPNYATNRPVIEVTVRPEDCPIELLSGLPLESVTMITHVTADTNLVIANDSGPLDPAKPFEPFGPRPTSRSGSSAGSRFLVGSRDIFSKRLVELTFEFEWKDMPSDLGTHYLDYAYASEALRQATQSKLTKPADQTTASSYRTGTGQTPNLAEPINVPVLAPPRFSVSLGCLDGGTWKAVGSSTHQIFGASSLPVSTDELALSAAPETPFFTEYTPSQQRGFLRMELASPEFGFGHDLQPHLFAVETARAIRTETDPRPVPAPVTPTLTRISASYDARDDLDPNAGTAGNVEFFHVEPHGAWAVPVVPGLPLAPAPEGDAAFFVGLADLASGSLVSLLVHLADGSGDPFAAHPEVTWSYLAGDTWTSFDAPSIVYDSTLGLRRTGLLTLALPADATTIHTRMPGGRIWLRALAIGDTAALNLAYAVVPQAAEFVFAPSPLNDLDRLAAPLAAGSISKLAVAQPAVKKLSQPLPSFGGSVEESGPRFHRRASERLRHRARASELWDFERLVLEAFPLLHRVKCVTHATIDSSLAPGNVLVVVVPDPQGGDAMHPLQPAATQDVLAAVREFLVPRVSGLARIEVVNPLYEELQVVSRVKLVAGNDLGFRGTELAGELQQFLAPWVDGDATALDFTGEVHPSQILNFIEERSYVDFVRDFTVRQWVAGAPLSPDPIRLHGTTARSILTSHPEHLLVIE